MIKLCHLFFFAFLLNAFTTFSCQAADNREQEALLPIKCYGTFIEDIAKQTTAIIEKYKDQKRIGNQHNQSIGPDEQILLDLFNKASYATILGLEIEKDKKKLSTSTFVGSFEFEKKPAVHIKDSRIQNIFMTFKNLAIYQKKNKPSFMGNRLPFSRKDSLDMFINDTIAHVDVAEITKSHFNNINKELAILQRLMLIRITLGYNDRSRWLSDLDYEKEIIREQFESHWLMTDSANRFDYYWNKTKAAMAAFNAWILAEQDSPVLLKRDTDSEPKVNATAGPRNVTATVVSDINLNLNKNNYIEKLKHFMVHSLPQIEKIQGWLKYEDPKDNRHTDVNKMLEIAEKLVAANIQELSPYLRQFLVIHNLVVQDNSKKISTEFKFREAITLDDIDGKLLDQELNDPFPFISLLKGEEDIEIFKKLFKDEGKYLEYINSKKEYEKEIIEAVFLSVGPWRIAKDLNSRHLINFALKDLVRLAESGITEAFKILVQRVKENPTNDLYLRLFGKSFKDIFDRGLVYNNNFLSEITSLYALHS